MYKYRIRRRISEHTNKDILLKEGNSNSIKIEFVIQQRERYSVSNIIYNILSGKKFISYYNKWEDKKICNTVVEAIYELNKIDPKFKIKERTIKY